MEDYEELIEKAKAEYVKNGRSVKFERYEDDIMLCIDALKGAYLFARDVEGADKDKLQNFLVDACDYSRENWTDLPGLAVEYVYKFAQDVKGADIAKLQRAVIGVCDRKACRLGGYDSNCPDIGVEYVCKFAENIEGADIDKLQKVIINMKKSEHIYHFAQNVKGADIDKLQKAIFDCDDDLCFTYISMFANFVKGADVAEMQKMAIEQGAEYICSFATQVKDSNKEELTDAIIASGDVQDIYEFAKNVEGANIAKLQEAILSKSEARPKYWAFRFAKYVEGADLDKFQDWAINSKNIGYMETVAKIRDEKGLPVDKLEDMVIKYGDSSRIADFSLFVKGSNSEKLQKAFEKTKAKEDADTFNV